MLGSDDGSARRKALRRQGVWGSAVKLPQWGSGAEPQQNWLGVLGERYELPQWAANEFGAIWRAENRSRCIFLAHSALQIVRHLDS